MNKETVPEAMNRIRSSYSKDELELFKSLQEQAKRNLEAKGIYLRSTGNFLFGAIDSTITESKEPVIFEFTGANTRGISCLPFYNQVVPASFEKAVTLTGATGTIAIYDAGHRFPGEQEAIEKGIRRAAETIVTISKEKIKSETEIRDRKLFINGLEISLIVGDYIFDNLVEEITTPCINTFEMHRITINKRVTGRVIENYLKKKRLPNSLVPVSFGNDCTSYEQIEEAVRRGLEECPYLVLKPIQSSYARGVRMIQSVNNLQKTVKEAMEEHEREFGMKPASFSVSAYCNNATIEGHAFDSRMFVGVDEDNIYTLLGGVVRVARNKKFDGNVADWFNTNLTVIDFNTGKKHVENERMHPFSKNTFDRVDQHLNEADIIKCMENLLLGTVALDTYRR